MTQNSDPFFAKWAIRVVLAWLVLASASFALAPVRGALASVVLSLQQDPLTKGMWRLAIAACLSFWCAVVPVVGGLAVTKLLSFAVRVVQDSSELVRGLGQKWNQRGLVRRRLVSSFCLGAVVVAGIVYLVVHFGAVPVGPTTQATDQSELPRVVRVDLLAPLNPLIKDPSTIRLRRGEYLILTVPGDLAVALDPQAEVFVRPFINHADKWDVQSRFSELILQREASPVPVFDAVTDPISFALAYRCQGAGTTSLVVRRAGVLHDPGHPGRDMYSLTVVVK